MLHQLGLGTALILSTVIISALAFGAMELAMGLFRGWLHRRPFRPKQVLVLGAAVLWMLVMLTSSVWIWALTFFWLDVFESLEAAVYFSLVAFTTLGFGDILLPQEWRLLGGMSAANGLLTFGLSTAMLVEVMRNLRNGQDAARRESEG